MAKVITTLVADGIGFDDICSFKTDNFIGIWCHNHERFLLMEKSNLQFRACILPLCNDLEQLDREVYSYCDEHIEEVFENSTYEFVLDTGK